MIRPKLRNIMFVGTGSDVGKSIINAAFCRIFKQDGFSPAPFKAQNMSLNSYATPNGCEIGRAQAVQAEACQIECSTEMNPILIKPTSYTNAQIILNGKPMGNKSAMEYFNGTDRDMLFSEAMKSFNILDKIYNPIVIEGAGSISEVNLWDRDITNMRVALEIKAAVFLIADIDRGGVFGSVYGTLQLLPEIERKLIRGIIINKFRGDIRLFEDGKKKLEELCGIPVVSVIPYFSDIYIDQEDSVMVDEKNFEATENKINIAVILLRHMSNFTDFNMLEHIPGIQLYYAKNITGLLKADIVIIPGSKNTISDMIYLRDKGLASEIIRMHKNGTPVYGICGGFQIMGKEINDPYHVEGDIETIPGLGILPVITILNSDKITEQCRFKFRNMENTGAGYEIHMGETVAEYESPLCITGTKKKDGFFLNGKTWGTYIHGIFDNDFIIKSILKEIKKESGITFDNNKFKNEQYDKLAKHVRLNSNMDYIYKTINN